MHLYSDDNVCSMLYDWSRTMTKPGIREVRITNTRALRLIEQCAKEQCRSRTNAATWAIIQALDPAKRAEDNRSGGHSQGESFRERVVEKATETVGKSGGESNG